MTLRRMILLFMGVLAVMVSAVVLRAEATRVHYEIAELDRRDDGLRQEVRKEQLALQRARNPATLLERVKDMKLEEPKATPQRPSSKGNKP
jgi:hypothetical protein